MQPLDHEKLFLIRVGSSSDGRWTFSLLLIPYRDGRGLLTSIELTDEDGDGAGGGTNASDFQVSQFNSKRGATIFGFFLRGKSVTTTLGELELLDTPHIPSHHFFICLLDKPPSGDLAVTETDYGWHVTIGDASEDDWTY